MMTPDPIKVEFKVDFKAARKGRKRAVVGEKPAPPPALGRIPRVSRLMALALRFEKLIQDREVRDSAEIARLGHVSRARVTQLTNLLHLAPDLQEKLLFLPRVESGRDPVTERDLRPIAAIVDWRKQRAAWKLLRGALE